MNNSNYSIPGSIIESKLLVTENLNYTKSNDYFGKEFLEMSQLSSNSIAKMKIDDLNESIVDDNTITNGNNNVETTIINNNNNYKHLQQQQYNRTNPSASDISLLLKNNNQINGINNLKSNLLNLNQNGSMDDDSSSEIIIENNKANSDKIDETFNTNHSNNNNQIKNSPNHDYMEPDQKSNENITSASSVTETITEKLSKNQNFDSENASIPMNGLTFNNNNKTNTAQHHHNHNIENPFPYLAGEKLQHQENTDEYSIYLTNYRLYVKIYKRMSDEWHLKNHHHQQQEQLFCVPINNIDSVEIRDLYFLTIYTKYIESFVITFENQESATTWHKRLSDIQDVQIKHLFCFEYYQQLVQLSTTSAKNAVLNENKINDLVSINQNVINLLTNSYLLFKNEFERMNFDPKYWRICEINKDFKFCSSYPECFIVPNETTDNDLESVANFRYSRRIPVAVWRSRQNGCVILRSSQPVVGWLGWRSSQDERMLQKILKICIKDTQKYHLQNDDNLQKEQKPHTSHTSMIYSNGINGNGYLNDDALPQDDHQNGDNLNHHDNNVKDDNHSNQKINNNSSSSNGQINGNVVNGNGCTTTVNNSCHNNNNTMNNLNNHSLEKLDEDQQGSTNKLLILDARSYTAAFANRAMGGGCECPEYYTSCDVQFMGLNNIHSIRKSYYTLRYICELSQIDQSNWFTLLDNTKWLHNLAGLLKAAVVVVDSISIQERPVLVHCSDGWDRTPQVIALAELMLDPYYRTIDGFQTLIEKDWLKFGHKFADRCRSSTLNIDPNERCPVFLQWVDCVHQLVKQFPHEFEFNVHYLMKLVYHSYSCLFGTFIGNNVQERVQHEIYSQTISLWSYFKMNKNNFINYLYMPKQEILRPSCRVKDIIFWNEIYVPISNNNNTVTNIIPCNGICNSNVNNNRCSTILNNNNNFKNEDNNYYGEEINNNQKEFNCNHEIQCQSQSKCDLYRSASFESICETKICNKSPALNKNLKLTRRHLSDSCLIQKNQLLNELIYKFHNPADLSVSKNTKTCDQNLCYDDKNDQPIMNNLNDSKNCNDHHYPSSMDINQNNCSEKHSTDCATINLDENSSIPLISSTESLTLFDIDGQIIGKNSNQMQLEQMINYHMRMIRCLTNQLKFKKKI